MAKKTPEDRGVTRGLPVDKGLTIPDKYIRVSCGPKYVVRAYKAKNRKEAWELYKQEFGMRVERNGGVPYFPEDHPEDVKPQSEPRKPTRQLEPMEPVIEAPPSAAVSDD